MRTLSRSAADAGQQPDAVDRHPAAEAGRGGCSATGAARWSRSSPRTGDVLAFVSKPTFDPNLFVDGIDAENWKALNESPDKPLLNRRAARHLPARLDLQAVHGAGGARRRASARRSRRSPIPGYFMLRRPPLPRRQGRRPRHGRHVQVDRACRATPTTTSLANEMGVDAIHDFMTPLGFGQLDRHRPARRAARRAAVDRVEARRATASRSSRSGTPARRSRSASARATTPSPCCSWRRRTAIARQRRRSALQPHLVRAIERRRQPRARAADRAAGAPSRCRWKPEHVAVIHNALVGVTQEGTSAPRVRERAATVRRQDRHRAGDRASRRTRSTTPRKIDERHRDHALYIAFAPADKPRIALALIVENAGFGAAAAAPIARRVFDYCAHRPVPERGRHRRRPARPGDRADRHAATDRLRAAARHAPSTAPARRRARDPAASRSCSRTALQ